ncbi:MAG: UDP-N-acetylglucosamine 2-epimerase (non-hydrolyzing) [Deinococcus sp.]|nr:UDP-N-acetylglucosamine 2-epimerase (non-hydrolyzing) [Deinococcus sp.]
MKILLCFGTRPEAVKLAPVYWSLKQSPDFQPAVLVTGQHREMLDQMLQVFAIQPDYDLAIMVDRQPLADTTARALTGVAAVLQAEPFDFLLVQGDTQTTLAAALAGYYAGVPVGHVEAGLRTGQRRQPFPEELMRRLTSQLAELHLSPTTHARANLLREGIDPATIFVTGNTVVDALLSIAQRAAQYSTPLVAELQRQKRRIIALTAHRRENWEHLSDICHAVRHIVRTHRDVSVVYPVHLNPAVREMVLPALQHEPNVHLIDPLEYAPMVALMQASFLLLTDSGGIQEEAPALHRPVLVLRQVTERPEGVIAGTLELVGTDPERITSAVHRLLTDAEHYQRMASAPNPYGDGHAAQRCVQALRHRLLGGPRPEEFIWPV